MLIGFIFGVIVGANAGLVIFSLLLAGKVGRPKKGERKDAAAFNQTATEKFAQPVNSAQVTQAAQITQVTQAVQASKSAQIETAQATHIK